MCNKHSILAMPHIIITIIIIIITLEIPHAIPHTSLQGAESRSLMP